MFARRTSLSSIGRIAAFASVSALMLSAVTPSPALAASLAASPADKGSAAVGVAGPVKSSATDFSARRRSFGGGAAAAAAFAGIIGTGLAIAAARNRAAAYGYYDGYDGYYGGPAYYGGPVYYGGGPYYPYDPGYGDGSRNPYPASLCAQGASSQCW